MPDEEDRRALSADEPLHAPRRKTMGPALITLLLLAVIIGAMLLIFVAG